MSADAAVEPAAQRSGVGFAGVFAVTFCSLIAVGAVLPVLPRYVRGPIGAGDVAVGVVIGVYAIAGLLLRPVAGRLADRWGRKPTAIVGALLIGTGGLINLPYLGLGGLILARLVLGAGEGSLYTAGSAWVVDMAPPARRGRVLGLYGLAVWGGLAIGPLIGELVLESGGYRAVWIFAAVMPFVGALLATRAKDPFVPVSHTEPHPLIAPEALGPGAAIALAAVGYATLAAFIVLHLEARGVGHGAAVFGAFAATLVATRLLAGDLPDRLGPARVATLSALGEGVGLLAIGLAHSLPVALAGGMAMGAAFSLLNPALMLIAVGRVSESARGATMGTYTALFDAGVGIGAPLAGLAASLAGYEASFLVAAAIALGSAVLIGSTIARR